MKRVFTILSIILLTGCSSLFTKKEEVPKVEIVNRYVPIEIYHPPMPAGVNLLDVQFFVITSKNVDEKLKQIEKLQGNTPVVFAMTPQDYENMSYNLQELKRIIRQQKTLIDYYKDATQVTEDINGDGSIDIEDFKAKNIKLKNTISKE